MRGLLALVALAAGGILTRAFLMPPDYGRAPRLAAVVDGGKMEEFLQTAAEKEAVLRFVADGAPETGWPEVSAVLERRCVSCHYTDAEAFEILPLDAYGPAARAAEVEPTLREKITGGTMGEYLESPKAQQALLAWIDAGAREATWPAAQEILSEHCVHCHNPEGVQGIPRLDVYRPAARLATMPEPAPRPFLIPTVVLVASSLGLSVYGRFRKSPGMATESSRTLRKS